MESPTDLAVKVVSEIFEETDDKGRVLQIRKPPMLAQFRFVGMLGKAADSEVYLNMCVPLIYLYSIDGDNNLPCGTIREMEALIQRLGEAGIKCLNESVAKHFSGNIADDEDKEEIKK